MKRLHRRMTQLLAKQLKQQEKRLRNCTENAWLFYNYSVDIEQGTFFTTRPKRL